MTRSNADLDEFAYTASHDLKEPLRGLHTYATILLEDYGEVLDTEGQAKLATLSRLTQRMDALIDALLELSRVGRAEAALQETAIGREVLAEIKIYTSLRLITVVILTTSKDEQELKRVRILCTENHDMSALS